MMSAPRVGIIGLGAFGSRVAMRLLWSGFHTLQIYDLSEETPRVFSNNWGGLHVGSPKMMAQSSDIIVTVLPSAAAIRDVCFGWQGLATGFPRGGILLDLGVTDPLETVALAEELKSHSVDLVDAPAFGTPDSAGEGKLTLIVGGDEDAVQRSQPVLEKLAAKIIRAGAPGSAQAAGAVADYMRAVRLLAAGEAIQLGAHFGFDATNLLDVCDRLGGADLPRLLRDDMATRRFKSGHSLGILRANVELAVRLAKSAGVVLPLMAPTRTALGEAEARLGYGADQSSVIKWLETAAADADKNSESKTEPDDTANAS
jgi:3-hydroxyisobutyrate dehydrogenase-like beta-hydroxyacid dehydrogenase